MNDATHPVQWKRPEMLADADTHAALRVVCEEIAESGQTLSTATIRTMAGRCAAQCIVMPAAIAARWSRAYERVAGALS